MEVTNDELDLIRSIARRAAHVARTANVAYPPMDAALDVLAVHVNGNPLRLDELLCAKTADFAHDIFGIQRHLDRDTGKLQMCFKPRYTR